MNINPDVALPAGIYQHYKGPLYLVLGLAHDANSDSLFEQVGADDFRRCDITEQGVDIVREVVVYVGLQLDAAHEGARIAVRTLQDFFARVCMQPEHRHYRQATDDPVCLTKPRFSYLGPRFVDGMQA